MARNKKIIISSAISGSIVLLSLGIFALHHDFFSPAKTETETEIIEPSKQEESSNLQPETIPETMPEAVPETMPESQLLPEDKPAGFNIAEILDWNFSSVVGVWVSSDGKVAKITDNRVIYDNRHFLIYGVHHGVASSVGVFLQEVGDQSSPCNLWLSRLTQQFLTLVPMVRLRAMTQL